MTEKKGQFLLIKAHALNARVKGNAKQLKRSLSAAARNNTREFDEPNSDIDPTLTKRNTTLLGLPNSSAGILALKEAVHKEWGIESGRVDQTIAVEVVVSLRRTPNGISEDAYFAGAAKWAETWYGGRIISAMVHRDQAYPHAHIIILLNIGKGRPSGSKQIGYKKEANEMKLAFASAYSNQYGVYLPPPKLTGAERRDASRQVHQYMMANHYPAVSDPIWPFLSAAINTNPAGAAREIGYELEAMPVLRELAARTVKGSRRTGAGPTREASKRTLVAAVATTPMAAHASVTMGVAGTPEGSLSIDCKTKPLACVDVPLPTPSSTCISLHDGVGLDDEPGITRERDSEWLAEHYNPITGDCRPPPAIPTKRSRSTCWASNDGAREVA